MENSSIFLILMLISYSIPILCVGYYYSHTQNNSISSVIAMEECQLSILCAMCMMGVFTLLYEQERKCMKSFCSIVALLIGIYGVILIKEDISLHYIFGGCVFISMIVFMYIQCEKWSVTYTHFKYMIGIHIILTIVLMIQCIQNTDIFVCEALLLISFAIYYLYVHYLIVTHSPISLTDDAPVEKDRQDKQDRQDRQDKHSEEINSTKNIQ
jgi:hypothetical protein